MNSIVEQVAGFMALSARTAPKARGQDFIEIITLNGSDITRLAEGMFQYGRDSGRPGYDRDGENVRNSSAVLLLSLKDSENLGAHCGACGYDSCLQADANRREGMEFAGPMCAWRLIDLGIALGSAVKTASLFNADNRIMYRIGVVARRMNFIGGDVAVGIPLSASGKSIYFDR